MYKTCYLRLRVTVCPCMGIPHRQQWEHTYKNHKWKWCIKFHKDGISFDHKVAKETLSGQNLVEDRSMTASVTISCVKFCPHKGFLSAIYCVVIRYLPWPSAGIYSQVCRTSLGWKNHEKRLFYTKRSPVRNELDSCVNHLVCHSFTSKSIPALPRCPGNKNNTSLWSKEDAIFVKLDALFSFAYFLGICSITDYGECPCMGELQTYHP